MHISETKLEAVFCFFLLKPQLWGPDKSNWQSLTEHLINAHLSEPGLFKSFSGQKSNISLLRKIYVQTHTIFCIKF